MDFRLRFQCVVLLLFFAVLLAKPALAETAKESLDSSLVAVLDILKRPEYADPVKRKALREDIARIVRKKFDFYEFSTRTVGQQWQSFSQKQKNDFADAFANLLISTYVSKIDGYNGEQIVFTGEKASSKGDRVEIMTVVTMKSGKKIPVNYRMLPKDGTWKVYDVLIENISLVKNYRTQFQDLLKTKSPEEVIDRIRARTLEVQEHGNEKK
ncbi:MAG: ABC transporter substrate-binding protein [Desulfovibrionaceae bacterium]|nr:ABC transporter substrate-binding protein [Desulfovibrionaceae bacterium]